MANAYRNIFATVAREIQILVRAQYIYDNNNNNIIIIVTHIYIIGLKSIPCLPDVNVKLCTVISTKGCYGDPSIDHF